MASELDRDLLVELECPICTDYLYPPIRQCITGHTFCERCYTKMKQCPTCRQPKSTARSFVLERLHAKLVFPCRSRLEGCHFVDVGSKIRQHEDECVFGKMACPLKVINECEWTGSAQHVIRHCQEHHPNNVFVTDKQKLTCSNFLGGVSKSSYYIVFQVKEELFKCVWDVDFQSGLMHWCVFHLGSPELTNNFAYEVDFAGKIALRAPCQVLPDSSASDGGVDVLTGGNSVITHYDMIKKFCSDSDLIYTIKIIDKTD